MKRVLPRHCSLAVYVIKCIDSHGRETEVTGESMYFWFGRTFPGSGWLNCDTAELSSESFSVFQLRFGTDFVIVRKKR